MKLAVVGSGPSAFYVATRLFKLLPTKSNLRVHLYDRLWAPYGLVRYGVAPDHPEVKNCIHKFEETAKDPRFRFFGNVEIVPPSAEGREVKPTIPHAAALPLSQLMRHYTHVLFATGCIQPNIHPALPTTPPYCIPALQFVHWYTQHPSVVHLAPPALDKVQHVTLIGNGNVSLDVARMLLTPVSRLRAGGYDIPESVLEVLDKSAVRRVSVVGRRGPLEAAFSMKELREMMDLEGVGLKPVDEQLLGSHSGATLSRQQKRVVDLLKRGSKTPYSEAEKEWELVFYRAPKEVSYPPHHDHDRIRLTLAHTTVDPTLRTASPTGETSVLETDMIIPSLSSHAPPQSTPFYDEALGRIRSDAGGRVMWNGSVVPRVYVSGWAAMGAKGVLGSTMVDAFNVAETIIADSSTQEEEKLPDLEFDQECVTSFDDWKRVDSEEVARGARLGKERERVSSFEVVRSLTAR